MTIIEKIKAEIERRIKIQDDWAGRKVLPGRDLAFAAKEELKQLIDFLDTIEESGDGLEIVKEARITPGMLSNFGTSYFVIDVELTQEEQSKLHLAPGFGSCGVKMKIVCE